MRGRIAGQTLTDIQNDRFWTRRRSHPFLSRCAQHAVGPEDFQLRIVGMMAHDVARIGMA